MLYLYRILRTVANKVRLGQLCVVATRLQLPCDHNAHTSSPISGQPCVNEHCGYIANDIHNASTRLLSA